jgi:hypothetical protein
MASAVQLQLSPAGSGGKYFGQTREEALRDVGFVDTLDAVL